jgi:hypothetical protein
LGTFGHELARIGTFGNVWMEKKKEMVDEFTS